MNNLFTRVLYEMEENRSTVLVTIIDEAGSAPRGTGAQMLVGETCQLLGTVGGGPGEKAAELLALDLIREKRSTLHEYKFHANKTEDLGAICGGDVTMYFQYIAADDAGWKEIAGKLVDCVAKKQKGWLIQHLDGSLGTLVDADGNLLAGAPAPLDNCILGSGNVRTGNYFSSALPIGERAILFGAGHCTYALAPLLQTVGFRVTVFDEREAFANPDRFPGAEAVICGDFSRIEDYLTLSPEDYVVVMTSGHKHDLEVQEQILRRPLTYVGVIGSKKKIAAHQAHLREVGIAEERIKAVHTPIGIPIKSVTPEEIAVSITGEIILTRANAREAAGIETHSCPMH